MNGMEGYQTTNDHQYPLNEKDKSVIKLRKTLNF